MMVEFDDRDISNVRAMAPEARLYAVAQDDEFDGRVAFLEWMDAGRYPEAEEK
jgi:hypothetical protein